MGCRYFVVLFFFGCVGTLFPTAHGDITVAGSLQLQTNGCRRGVLVGPNQCLAEENPSLTSERGSGIGAEERQSGSLGTFF